MQEHEILAQLLNQSSDVLGSSLHSDVRPVSGTQIGEALGVSRVSVQKRVQALVDAGLPLNAVPGKGYSLDSGVSLLSAKLIGAHLDVELCESIEILQVVESTNSHLLSQEVLSNRAKLCVAESQSAGRGRRGNHWQSAPYRNVMLSISWGFDHWPETITGLGLAVALCITEAINERYQLDVQIKWPNDLMIGNDKLAGILIDVAGESSGSCNVVVGLGLNVHQTDWSSDDAAYSWVDLRALSPKVDRNELVGLIAKELTQMFDEFSETGFAPMLERWNALSSYRGKQVRVGSPDDYVQGLMLGVDEVGALLIETAEGVQHRFADSNVSVRLFETAVEAEGLHEVVD